MPTNLEKVLIGEAANQGEEGLRMVAETIRNRAKGNPAQFEAEATKPHQFTAFSRPDLDDFYNKQPKSVREMAKIILQDVSRPDYKNRFSSPKGYGAPTHYMTKSLFLSPQCPSWAKTMKVVGQVGDHVLLAEKER